MDALAEQIQKQAADYGGIESVALAYSGGLDSDVVGSILQEWGVNVYPVVLEMGGLGAQTKKVEAKAHRLFGQCRVADITPDIIRAAERGVKANCLFSGHLNSGAFSRPFMAQALARVAREEKLGAVAHGSSGVGNDHLRMELALRVLAPELRALSPVRDWDLRRDQALAYARRNGGAMASSASAFSADENVWGRIVRQGGLVEPGAPLPPGAWSWTADATKAPSTPADVTIEFSQGIARQATVVEGRQKRTAGREGLMRLLNEAGGRSGVGRQDLFVDKVIGLKMRELHECPAAAILVAAHSDLERLTLTDSELEAKGIVDRLWNKCVYDGGWFSRLRRNLDAFVDESQQAVEGRVKLRLYKGGCSILSRTSRRALYDARLGRRDSKGVLSQQAVRAFARLYGLQDTMAYLLARE